MTAIQRLCIGVVGAFGLLVAVAGAARAASVGDEIAVRIACKSKEAIQAQVDMVLEDKGYERASALLQAAQMARECVLAPYPVPVIVVEAGTETTFVDSDGDTMSIQVVHIEVNGATYWSVNLTKAQSI